VEDAKVEVDALQKERSLLLRLKNLLLVESDRIKSESRQQGSIESGRFAALPSNNHS
jgi:hypothetical protein